MVEQLPSHDGPPPDDEGRAAPPTATMAEDEPPEALADAQLGPSRIDETLVDEAPRAGPKAKQRVLGGLEPGTQIGHYHVLERVGAGAMGVVYAAYDPRLDRKVALKLLRPAGHRVDVERARQRLMREAQALAKLEHPNVVTVYDVGTYLDQIFVAMEFVDGPTLGRWLEGSPTIPQIVEVFIAAGEGLAAAHAAGLVHRDFKPDNVMLDKQGRPRVMDFGLARSPEELADEMRDSSEAPGAREAGLGASGDALSTPLTHTGALLGTPAYMSPEQHMGLPADARSDQFSFCVTLFEALYGQRPFAGKTVAQLGMAITEGRIREPPPERRVPGWLRAVALRGLTLRPDARHPGMPELIEALRDDPSRRRQRWLGIGVAAVVAAMVGVGAYRLATQGQRACEGGEAQFARSWSPTQAAAMRESFRATGRPWAEDAAEHLAQEIDRFGARWAGLHREACLATHVRKEQSESMLDRQMVCLDRSRREFEALAARWVEADAKTVDAAVRAASELPGVAECEDLEALARDDSRPPPALTVPVGEAQAQLGRVRASRLTGHVQSAREELAAVDAAALDFAPLRARVELERGLVEELAGDFEAATTAFEAAYATGLLERVDAVSARAAAELVYVEGYRLARHDRGYAWAQQAELWAQRVDPKGPQMALVLHNHGVLLDAAGDSNAAEPKYREALALRRESLGPTHPLVGRSTHNLGNVFLDRGEYDEARAHYERAIEIYGHSYGPQHPIVAGSLNNVGLTYRRQQRFDEAVSTLRRAAEIYEAAFGAEHPDLALSLDNLGLALLGAGELEAARTAIERAMQIRRARLASEHPDLADSACALARVALAAGEPDVAAEHARAALERYEQAFGPEHFQVATASWLLGRAQLAQGDTAAALPALRRAEALRARHAHAASPHERAEAAHALALAELTAGTREAGEAARARAREAYLAAGPDFAAQAAAFEAEFSAAAASE